MITFLILIVYVLISTSLYIFAYKKGMAEGEEVGRFKGYKTGFKDGYEEYDKHKKLGYVKSKNKQKLGKDDINYLKKRGR